jgi:hypothetical protein
MAAALLVAAGLGGAPVARSQPGAQLPPPLLDPGWAFDPSAPSLPGKAGAPLLLPGDGGRFNPNAQQREAIGGPRPPLPPCPLLVPRRFFVLQPLRIRPEEVAWKNRLGCLSAADAIYGPDGCPKRLCGKAGEGPIRLPAGGP